MQETQVRFLGCEDPLEREMATHSNILAWRIPWTVACQAPLSMGSQELVTTQQLSHHSTRRQIACSLINRSQSEASLVYDHRLVSLNFAKLLRSNSNPSKTSSHPYSLMLTSVILNFRSKIYIIQIIHHNNQESDLVFLNYIIIFKLAISWSSLYSLQGVSHFVKKVHY